MSLGLVLGATAFFAFAAEAGPSADPGLPLEEVGAEGLKEFCVGLGNEEDEGRLGLGLGLELGFGAEEGQCHP